MKLSKKVQVIVTHDGDFYKMQTEGLTILTRNDPQLENNILDVEVLCSGKVLAVVNEREEILAILGKLEKYQSGKMSEKESVKMLNKLKTHMESLSQVTSKIEKQEPLEVEDIKSLESFLKVTNYKIEYGAMKPLFDENWQVEMNGEAIFPSEDYQSELEEQFKIEQDEKIKQDRETVARIMGVSPKRRTVVDYLSEKNKQMLDKAVVVFNIDGAVSLPQANDLERVLEWGQEIHNNPSEQLDLEVLNNDHDSRDVGYYSAALRYLGLVFVDDKSLCLTYAGENFFSHDKEAQKAIVLDILMKDDLVAAIFHSNLSAEELKEQFNARGLTGETINRRTSCLLSWKKYLTA